MQDEVKAHLEYLLKMNQLAEGFNLDVLKAQREILEQRMAGLKSLDIISEYEPVFTFHQTPFGKKQ